MNRKKLILFVLPVFMFIGCEKVKAQFTREPGFRVVSDTIIIASEPDYPPYSLLDDNGNAIGFAVDLFKAAAKEAGLEVKIKIGLWNVIKEELAEGKIDALPVVGRTPERDSIFDFSFPYLSLHGAVFVRINDHSITSLTDLKNKKILVMKGDNSEEFVRRVHLSDFIITTNTFEEAFQKLANGEGDAVITQQIIGLNLIEQMKLKTVVVSQVEIPEFRQDFCFAVKKGNTALLSRLNEGLSIIIANNTFDKIHTKWFGSVLSENISYSSIIKIGLLIFVPLAILISLFLIFILRRQIHVRTRELNNEIEKHKNTLMVLEKQQKLLSESESQIRLLLNSTAEGIYGIDTKGNCIFINKAALQVLLLSDAQNVIGKNMHDLIHHSNADGTEHQQKNCKIMQTLQFGIGTRADDEVFWRSNGTFFPVEYYSYPIQQNSVFIGAVVTFWDITERKRASEKLKSLTENLEKQVKERTIELEEKVEKLNKSQRAMLYMVEDLNRITQELKEERFKLEQSNKELDAFSYSVSHDLRSPLRAIDGFSNFLIEDYSDKLDEEGKRYLSVIRENTIKMDVLISDILRLSRVSRAELKYAEVDMKATVYSMFMEISTKEEKQQFTFDVKDIPPAFCDINLIKQVLKNLIGNALKYSSKSAIKKIEIGAEENENEIIYNIRDFGVGFDPNYAYKLFGVFQRLHRDTDFEGTGVGLAVVQRIITRHGGKVWAESELGKGATFYFSLSKQ